MRADDIASLALKNLRALLNYAFRLTRDREEAEDLVQDTFERTYSNRQRFPGRAAVRPMMFRILHNLFVNQRLSRGRRPVIVSLEEWEEGGKTPAAFSKESPLEFTIRNALSDEVEAALEDLEDAWRETLWLRAVEGCSYQEIAEITGVPVGTVRSRLARSRRALAQNLQEYARNRGIGPAAGEERR